MPKDSNGTEWPDEACFALRVELTTGALDAVLELIDECPGLTMEQDSWLTQRVRDLAKHANSAVDAYLKTTKEK